MQIVIDIPEEDYEIMKHNIAVHNPLCPISQEDMVNLVASGTPLPKGHGRLIDADAVMDNGINKVFCDWYDEIRYADTIIEADTEVRVRNDN